jgi:hypothetical protein
MRGVADADVDCGRSGDAGWKKSSAAIGPLAGTLPKGQLSKW